MDNKLSAIVILDTLSRGKINSNISIIGTRGFKLIDSLESLTDDLVSFSNNIIIFEGFFSTPSFLSDLELYKDLYDLQYFFLGSKSTNFYLVKHLGSVYYCDVSNINTEILQAALLKDYSLEDTTCDPLINNTKVATEIYNSSHCTENEHILAETVLALSDSLENVLHKLKSVELQNKKLQLAYNYAESNRKALSASLKDLILKALDERKTLKQFESILTKDVYTKIHLSDYAKKPLVIYLKEYEDFLGLDILVKTLFSVLRLQKQKSVKVLRLFDRSNSRKILTVPNYYKVLYNDYTMTDVLSNDFVCKSGDYTRILDKLLLNDMELDVLIVIDSKDYNDTILSENNIRFNLCREMSHAKAFQLNEVDTIVNNAADDTKYCWEQYDLDGLSPEDKFLYLSSRPVITGILQLLEIVEESV